MLIKIYGEIHESTHSWRLYHPPSVIKSFGKKKIKKNIAELNSTVKQGDIIEIHEALHSNTAGYTCFSSSHEAFTKTDHILCLNIKGSLKNLKKRNHTKYAAEHKSTNLEISNRKIAGKISPNT